jgi:hypothetical protein
MGTCTSKSGAFGPPRAYANYSRPVLPTLFKLIVSFAAFARAVAGNVHLPNPSSVGDGSGALKTASEPTGITQQPSARNVASVRGPLGTTIEGAVDVAGAACTPLHRLAGAVGSSAEAVGRGITSAALSAAPLQPPRTHGSGAPGSSAASPLFAAVADDATFGAPASSPSAVTDVARAQEWISGSGGGPADGGPGGGGPAGGGRAGGSPATTMLAAMSVIRNRLAPLTASHDGRGRSHAAGPHTDHHAAAATTAVAAAPLTIRAGGGGAEAGPSPLPGTPSLSIASDATARQQGLMWSGASRCKRCGAAVLSCRHPCCNHPKLREQPSQARRRQYSRYCATHSLMLCVCVSLPASSLCLPFFLLACSLR